MFHRTKLLECNKSWRSMLPFKPDIALSTFHWYFNTWRVLMRGKCFRKPQAIIVALPTQWDHIGKNKNLWKYFHCHDFLASTNWNRKIAKNGRIFFHFCFYNFFLFLTNHKPLFQTYNFTQKSPSSPFFLFFTFSNRVSKNILPSL